MGYTWLGDSDFIDVDSVFSGNVGVSRKFDDGSLGAGVRLPPAGIGRLRRPQRNHRLLQLPHQPTQAKMQLYAIKGLSDGSPDWGAGVSLTTGF